MADKQTSGTTPPKRIVPGKLAALDGSEPLAGGTVADFWQWALGDLRMNTARGYLAEYLVAKAVGDPSANRVEWGPWDVTAADGTKIEVKACGRLQSWSSQRLTPPNWTFKSVRAESEWDEALGRQVRVDPAKRVDVWVFALQKAEAGYDPLNTDQWEFRVISHRELLASGQLSAGLAFFERQGIAPVGYAELRRAVAAASQEG